VIVLPVESLRVYAVNVAHAPWEIRFRRLEKQVVMVRHQAVTSDMDRPKFHGLFQERDEGAEIVIIQEDTFFSPSAVHNVIPRVRIQNP
jgi:hypothetical protein